VVTRYVKAQENRNRGLLRTGRHAWDDPRQTLL
jgi:hypothetical protein